MMNTSYGSLFVKSQDGFMTVAFLGLNQWVFFLKHVLFFITEVLLTNIPSSASLMKQKSSSEAGSGQRNVCKIVGIPNKYMQQLDLCNYLLALFRNASRYDFSLLFLFPKQMCSTINTITDESF